MNGRRQTSDLTGRRQSGERRKDYVTRTSFDELVELENEFNVLFVSRMNNGIDDYQYRTRTRRLIEDTAKRIRVIQEKESANGTQENGQRDIPSNGLPRFDTGMRSDDRDAQGKDQLPQTETVTQG